jgi:hypothetical protein
MFNLEMFFCVVMNGHHESGSVNNKTIEFVTQQWLCHLKCFPIFKKCSDKLKFWKRKRKKSFMDCYLCYHTRLFICGFQVLANWICQSPQWKVKLKCVS